MFELWKWFTKNKTPTQEIKQRLLCLEEKIEKLEKLSNDDPKNYAPIIVEKLNVEKIIVERFEHNNNFGALGIKELSGKLNIGANYGLEQMTAEEKEKLEEEKKNFAKTKEKVLQLKESPNYVIRAKK